MSEYQVSVSVKRDGFFSKAKRFVKQKTYQVATVSTLAFAAVAPVASNAALAEIGAELSTEMEAGKLIIVAIMTLGATLLAMFAGYRYMKRGANSA
tara:strand:+ start:1593 stop:1880 length:288 start_codon:yes stop_codon:yes gene_type:complete